MADIDTSKIKTFVERTHDHMTSGETEDGLSSARQGTSVIRGVYEREGKAEAIKATQAAGSDEHTARAIVDVATTEKMPPSRLVRAMIKKTASERGNDVREAVCSFETGNWVDGKVTADDESVADVATKVLIEQAKNEKNPFKCFLLAAQIANRSVKAEFVGKMSLYVMSESFQKDLAVFVNGDADATAYADVVAVFGSIEKIINGAASEKDKTRFSRALSSRIEKGLELEKGGAWEISGQGPDAEAILPKEHKRSVLGVLYATANDSEDKSVATAKSVRRHWDGLTLKAQRIRLFFVAKPIVPCDKSRLKDGNKPLAEVGADVATLQVAESLFLAENEDVVNSLLEGRSEAEGLFFSTQKPFVLGRNIFDETKKAIENIARIGYPPDTERGMETWRVLTNTISTWARKYPETFPWFKDKQLVSWLESCPQKVSGMEDTAQATEAAIMNVERGKERSVQRKLDALSQKDSEAAKAAAVESVAAKMEPVIDSLVGKGKRYCENGYDAKALRAMKRTGDETGIRRVLDGERARKVREESVIRTRKTSL